jgi:hypothetical protein
MAPRDPNKTARNKVISAIKEELREILDDAMYESGKSSELELNAYIGSKNDDFIDLKNEVIGTPDEFISKWLQGMKKGYEEGLGNKFKSMYDMLIDPQCGNFRKYCNLFLRRSFLKRYDDLSKTRPHQDHASYWFGVNDADFGLFISPRFNKNTDQWENDVSEIRVFNEPYWTIGHILKTGICYPDEDRKKLFNTVDEYLDFFYDQIRLTKSTYQKQIAKKYIAFVQSSQTPKSIPLLLPEVKFSPGRKHKYRLDFLVIDPYTMDKIGIELSPWSTHGYLSGKHKTMQELNNEALSNFDREVQKIKDYYKKHNIYTLIFPDSDLQSTDKIFEDITRHLNPKKPSQQYSLDLFNEFLNW